ncbi:MAG: HEAT repeat domain-containing protein [Planctomycetes bacterium]|nr:HEAT repeat domain-containing protein [Planctomycetota bacterium]
MSPRPPESAGPLRLDARAADFETAFAAFLAKDRDSGADVDGVVRDIIADVRRRGDAAVLEYTARFDRLTLTPQTLRFSPQEIAQAVAGVPALLDDGCADVRAAAARVLGDVRLAAAAAPLAKALRDPNSRVRREAALALARLGEPAATAVPDVLGLLRDNDDRDAVLRHAGAVALAAIATRDDLQRDVRGEPRAVRLGVLLALARRQDPAVARFLADADAELRCEAARAIHGEPIPAALPDLARLCYDDQPDRVATDWRAIAANRQLGQVENGESLVHLATLAGHPTATRLEALQVLAEWRQPHGQDRVHGNWQPCARDGADTVAALFTTTLPDLLADDEVAAAAAAAAGRLANADGASALAALAGDRQRPPAARLAALDALAALAAPELAAALVAIETNAPLPLRRRAIELLARTAPEAAVPMLASILDDAPVAEQQAAFTALGDLPHAAADELLLLYLDRLEQGLVRPALQLDLLEAAGRRTDGRLHDRLAAHRTAQAAADPLGDYLPCRDGGDAARGRKVFFEHEATRCTRCHALGGQGSHSGPALDHVGGRLSRRELLEALVAPSATIAPGYGTATVQLHDGTVLVGIVTRDADGSLTLVDGGGTATEVRWSAIRERGQAAQSAMPPMGGALTGRQLRDLVEFLARQR